MSAVAKITAETRVKSFSDDFKNLPKNIRVFTLSLRSLYAGKAVSDSTDAGKSIIILRDETRQDATLYVNKIYSFSTEIVTYVEEFAEYYEVLEYDEWIKSIPDILEEVTGFQQCCEEIVKMHEDILVKLKKREDKAIILISKLKHLDEELEKKIKELKAKSASEGMWACLLLLIPVVGEIAAPILGAIAESDEATSLADMAQLHINEAAIIVVGNVLVPALKAFIHGLNAIAGFFNLLNEELTIFIREGERASEDPKRLHYIMMRAKAVEIKGSCKEFYAMVPGVRTDLECIPDKPDDQNYVDQWLKDEKERIKQKYQDKISAKLKKMLKM